jgi:hypothetical protein
MKNLFVLIAGAAADAELRCRHKDCVFRHADASLEFFCRLLFYRACSFCSILFGHDWSETLNVFAYRSEVGFKTLIFMSIGDSKHNNIDFLLIAFI